MGLEACVGLHEINLLKILGRKIIDLGIYQNLNILTEEGQKGIKKKTFFQLIILKFITSGETGETIKAYPPCCKKLYSTNNKKVVKAKCKQIKQ